VVRPPLRRLGFDLLRRRYYSPVPDLEALAPDTWTRESAMRGLHMEADCGLGFVEAELASYIPEFTPPRGPTDDPRDFYLDNPGPYGSIDAETLYAMVRRSGPSRVIELGSGFSTLAIADARARNGQQDPAGHVVCDPYPRPQLVPALESVADLRRISATELPLDDYAALRAGDLLFIDTSHTVKIGGEVNHLILDVLPVLAPGVLVHIHDIFLPFEYPRMLFEDHKVFFTEQYLLQAFLSFNPNYEILFSAYALRRKFPDQIARLVPSARGEGFSAAFWLRRTDAQP
jgi:hypothetical protein